MSGEFEAAGTAMEGALLGAAAEAANQTLGESASKAETTCLNCGAPLTGKFCAACGQKAHVHRTLAAIGHDILHSVLHFDGKLWRTLPMLAFRPGDLTRRYVHGERAKFVSPMALFLFAIFIMFAVFSFVGAPFSDDQKSVGTTWQEQLKQDVQKLDVEIIATEGQLAKPGLANAEKAPLEAKLRELRSKRNGIEFARSGKLKYPGVYGKEGSDEQGAALLEGESTGFLWLDKLIRNGGEKMVSNPSLTLYKLQSNGYKFSWLLIPLSLPFFWLATLGVRGHHLYDHAIFTTYSISFMCFLFLTLAILSRIGVNENWLGLAFILIPPVHLYKQLRHAYGLSRPGTFVRLIILSLSIWIVLLAFFFILLFLGILG